MYASVFDFIPSVVSSDIIPNKEEI